MSWRRGAYAAGWLATGALLDELAYWAVTHHFIDRGIWVLDGLRDRARI